MALAAAPPAPAAPAFAGGALEVRADGRVAPLGRPEQVVAVDEQAGPAVVERVDLVWGCRGDRRRAQLLEGDHQLATTPKDACAVRVDVRPPCPPTVDDSGLEEADAQALAAAAGEQHQARLAGHRQRAARLAAGFSDWGPGLRMVVTGGGPLRLTTSRLALESCGCDGQVARSLGDETLTILLPRLAGATVVWVRVPRYLGALHRVGAVADRSPDALAFQDPFYALDEALAEEGTAEQARSPSAAFSAPAGCDCAPCDLME